MLKQGKIEVKFDHKNQNGSSQSSRFFFAFVERGRGKKYLKIHFTNKEEDSGILPKKGHFRVKRGVFEGAAQGGLKSSARQSKMMLNGHRFDAQGV